MTVRAVAVLALVGVALVSGRAHAQQPPTGNVEADARERFERGVDALNRGAFELAAEYFEGSFERVPRAATMCNLALTFDRWGGHECDAMNAYSQCADLDRSGRLRDHAVERAEALQSEFDCGGPAPPDPTPPDATPPDTRPPGATPPGLPITAPWQGAPIASPFATPAPGVTTVEAQDPIVISGPTAPTTDPPSRSPGLLIAGVIAAVGAAASVTGAILLAQSASRDVDDLWNRYPYGMIPAGTPDADELASAHTASNISIALYITAGVLGAGSVAMIVFDLAQDNEAPSSTSTARRTELVVSPTSAMLRGTF